MLPRLASDSRVQIILIRAFPAAEAIFLSLKEDSGEMYLPRKRMLTL